VENYDQRIEYAIEHTEVLRPPQQTLATFGTTNIRYFLVTEPLYREIAKVGEETVIREGRVVAERPRIVTPAYLVNLFEGFEHGSQFADFLLRKYGAEEPGLLYRYKNEPKDLTIVCDAIAIVARRLHEQVDREGDPLTTIIKGVDDLWDICLMKFIHDIIRSSVAPNVTELERRGLLNMEAGVPRDARERIEELFEQVEKGEAEPYELKLELDRWGLFEEYEDRFFHMFHR